MTGGQAGLIGVHIVDGEGQMLGTVSALLVDPESLQGKWLQIELADRYTQQASVLPLAGASLNAAGVLVSPWPADMVARAPQVGEQISAEETSSLNTYYDLDR